jgi:hypothetical protein
VKSALAANAIGKTVSASVTVGAAAAVGVAGVVIPLRLSGAMGPSSASAASAPEVVPADPELAQVHAGSKELVESAGAMIAVHDDAPAHAVFWRDDEHDLGVVNADEILVIAHHRLLETLVVYTWEGDDEGRRIAHDELFSDALFTGWRREPQVEASVVAAGATDVRFSWREMNTGDGELTVRLIWGPAAADADGMRRDPEARASVFTVRIPALRRVR